MTTMTRKGESEGTDLLLSTSFWLSVVGLSTLTVSPNWASHGLRDEEGLAQLQLLLSRMNQNRKAKVARKKQAMIEVWRFGGVGCGGVG